MKKYMVNERSKFHPRYPFHPNKLRGTAVAQMSYESQKDGTKYPC